MRGPPPRRISRMAGRSGLGVLGQGLNQPIGGCVRREQGNFCGMLGGTVCLRKVGRVAAMVLSSYKTLGRRLRFRGAFHARLLGWMVHWGR
jgi:hypothetical protein